MNVMTPTEVEELYLKADGALAVHEQIAKAHRRLKQYAQLVEFLTEELATSHACFQIFLLAVRNSDPSQTLLQICEVAEAELRLLQQRLIAEMLDPEDAKQQASN
jgi:hypothetical protein